MAGTGLTAHKIPLPSQNKQSIDFSTPPPQAIDLEQAVLGALLIDGSALGKILNIVKPIHFFEECHGVIYEAIEALNANGDPIDLLTVTDMLRKKGKLNIAGGAFYVTELAARVSSSAHIQYHAMVILQMWIKRATIVISEKQKWDLYEDKLDLFEVIERFEKEKAEIDSIYDLLKMPKMAEDVANFEAEMRSDEDPIIAHTGMAELDAIIGAIRRRELFVLGARPGEGKTDCALSIVAHNLQRVSGFIIVFSLELTKTSIIKRLVSIMGDIYKDKINKKDLNDSDWVQIQKICTILVESKLLIFNPRKITARESAKRVKTISLQGDISLVVYDYLQIFAEEKNKKKNEQIADDMLVLKDCKDECNTSILVLAQLSRESDSSDKRNKMSAFSGSMGIETTGTILALINNPSAYGMNSDENGQPIDPTDRQIEVVKCRDGTIGTAEVKYDKRIGRFCDRMSEPQFNAQPPPQYNPFSGIAPNMSFGENVSSATAFTTGMDFETGDVNLPF